MQLLAEVLTALAGSDPAEAVPRAMVAIARHEALLGGAVWTSTAGDRELVLVAQAGVEIPASLHRLPVGEGAVGRAFASAHPLRIDQGIPLATVERSWLQQAGVGWLDVRPLVAAGAPVGVFGTCAAAVPNDEVLTDLEPVAAALTLGVGRRRAEDDAHRQRDLADLLRHVGDVVTADLDVEAVAQTVVDVAVALTDAAFGVVEVVNRDGDDDATSEVDEEEVEPSTVWAVSGATPDLVEALDAVSRSVAGRGATLELRPIRVADVLARSDEAPAATGLVRSYLEVPVLGPSRELMGFIRLGHANPDCFDERAERLVAGIADHAALAVRSANLHRREHVIALSFQRAALPMKAPPVAQGSDIAVRYLPAHQDTEVGGDWFDVTPLRDGRLALTVGDIGGHDVHAATVMATLRNVLRVYALDGHAPWDALWRVEQFMGLTNMAETVAVLHLQYEPATGEFTAARAGLVPPLRVDPGRRARWLDEVPHGPLLGLGLLSRPAHPYRGRLTPGAKLVLATDGLFEQRGELLSDRLEVLRARAGDAGDLPVEKLADQLVGEAGADAERFDDLALVIVSFDGP